MRTKDAMIKYGKLKSMLLTTGCLLSVIIAMAQPFWKSGIVADEFIEAKMASWWPGLVERRKGILMWKSG